MPNRISTAVILANGIATPYWRCGSGSTVLLLGAPEPIALALSAWFRVIVPDVPFDFSDVDAVRWLGGVYEGLGIAEAAIVAGPALRDAAMGFAQAAPDRVKGVIVADLSKGDVAELRRAVERAFG
jgi:pimeloyl-ACP methyl ester carboxylesterase